MKRLGCSRDMESKFLGELAKRLGSSMSAKDTYTDSILRGKSGKPRAVVSDYWHSGSWLKATHSED